MNNLKVLIVGAGAVGIYFGSKFSRMGIQVTFLERSEYLDGIRADGLKVISEIEQNSHYHPVVTDSLMGMGPQDLVLVCVKASETYEAAISLLPILSPSTMVLSLQNGIENEDILTKIVGNNLVIGTVLRFRGVFKTPDTMVQLAPTKLIFGEFEQKGSKREKYLSEIFTYVDIDHEITPSIKKEIWKKFLWDNAINPVCAVSGKTIEKVMKCTYSSDLVMSMMMEVQMIAEAEGVVIEEQEVNSLLHSFTPSPNLKAAMHNDLEEGKKLEIDPFLGYVLKKAKSYEISVPVNQALFNLLMLLDT